MDFGLGFWLIVCGLAAYAVFAVKREKALDYVRETMQDEIESTRNDLNETMDRLDSAEGQLEAIYKVMPRELKMEVDKLIKGDNTEFGTVQGDAVVGDKKLT